MRQVIIRGRGGQGVMEAAEVLATTLWRQGKSVQAFPSFEPEKPGAATAAFVRYDDEEIWLRCRIERADIMIVLDTESFSQERDLAALAPGGLLIVNDRSESSVAGIDSSFRVVAVNATQIARTHKLGSRLTPMVNVVMLGALAYASDDLPLSALEGVISEQSANTSDRLRAAVREAYERAGSTGT